MLTLITPPAALLTASQARARAPAITDASDALINTLVAKETAVIDGPRGLLGRAIGTQTWDWKPDVCGVWRGYYMSRGDLCAFLWPHGYIELPLTDFQSVTSITYKDTNGDTQTYSSANYIVSGVGGRGRVTLKSGSAWPTLGDYPEPLTIRFVCGYTTVPEPILQKVVEAAVTGFVTADREPGIASVTTDAGSVAYSFAANRTPRSIMLDAVQAELAPYRVF